MNREVKLKITETSDYILALSEEEIGLRDYVYQVNYEKTNVQIIQCLTDFQVKIANDKEGSFTKLKIVAYRPTYGVSDLDLPFLPEPRKSTEEDIENFLLKRFPEDGKHDNRIWQAEGWKKCLKESGLRYTEEDLRKAIEFGRNSTIFNNFQPIDGNRVAEIDDRFIRSLEKSKPEWFVAERITRSDSTDFWTDFYKQKQEGGTDNPDQFKWERLKTVINSHGEKVLVGNYLYKQL